MLKCVSFVAAVAWLAATICAQALSLDDVLRQHTSARGGSQAIEAVRSLEVRLTIVEPAFTLTGVYRATRDGRMRIDIFDKDKRVFSEGFDGQRGWQLPGDKTSGVDMSAEGEAAVRRGILGNIFGLHEFSGLGHKVRSGTPESVDGVMYHVVDVVFSDKFERRYYIDPMTFLIARVREDSALHPDIDSKKKKYENRPSDFRSISGVLHPFKNEKIDLMTGAVAATDLIQMIEVNPKLAPSLFSRP